MFTPSFRRRTAAQNEAHHLTVFVKTALSGRKGKEDYRHEMDER